MSDSRDKPIPRALDTHTAGTRERDNGTTPRRHGSQRRPHRGDEARMGNFDGPHGGDEAKMGRLDDHRSLRSHRKPRGGDGARMDNFDGPHDGDEARMGNIDDGRRHRSRRRPHGTGEGRMGTLDEEDSTFHRIHRTPHSALGKETPGFDDESFDESQGPPAKAKRADSHPHEGRTRPHNFPIPEVDDGGMGDVVDSLEASKMGSHVKHVRFAKLPHEEHRRAESQKKDHRQKEDRHKDIRHGKHRHEERRHGEQPQREHRPTDHRHKEQDGEYQMTEEELLKFSKKLYKTSLEPFREKSGSPYPCRQSEIDFHRQGKFEKQNKGPFVSLKESTEEVLRWNDEKRVPPEEELAIIRNLAMAIHDAETKLLFHPDLAIKTFADLDRVFFGGRLRGNVVVQWLNKIERGPREIRGSAQMLKPGQARIKLSGKSIFSKKWRGLGKNPVAATFHTLLHEMCHAYDIVRCPHERIFQDEGHHEHFQSKITVVHDRAMRIMGMMAIGNEGSSYQQHHFLPQTGEKGQKEVHVGGHKKKNADTWSNERCGSRRGTDCVVM